MEVIFNPTSSKIGKHDNMSVGRVQHLLSGSPDEVISAAGDFYRVCLLLSVAGPFPHSVHLAAVDAHSAEAYRFGFIR